MEVSLTFTITIIVCVKNIWTVGWTSNRNSGFKWSPFLSSRSSIIPSVSGNFRKYLSLIHCKKSCLFIRCPDTGCEVTWKAILTEWLNLSLAECFLKGVVPLSKWHALNGVRSAFIIIQKIPLSITARMRGKSAW